MVKITSFVGDMSKLAWIFFWEQLLTAVQKHCWVVPVDKQKRRMLAGFGGSLGTPEN